MRVILSGLMAALVLLSGCSSGDDVAVYEPDPAVAGMTLPAVTDSRFCEAIQKFLSSTDLVSQNTLFASSEEYVESKTTADPLTSYQYVTFVDDLPAVVSCKVKGAAMLRAFYGDAAAGEQLGCPAATAVIINQVETELRATGDVAAANRAAALVIDNNEPVIMGPNYLADYQISYVDQAGAVHITTPGLFQDYDHWSTKMLPETFVGTVYCHLPSHQFIHELVTGDIEPGMLIQIRK